MMDAGKYVEVDTKNGEILRGIVMQSSDVNILSLKLDSGYNIGVKKENISKIKELKKEKATVLKKKKEEIKCDPNLKTVSILHCGGTIASKVSYETGAVSPSFSPEDILRMFPELKTLVNIKSRLIGNVFSEDIRFGHYNKIAREIEKELKSGVDGIIITHGTDTLVYTAAALAFSLEHLSKPIILVGAQRSSDRPSSDAAINLLCAAKFIAKSDFSGVAICMHSNSGDDYCEILPACKTKKLHSSRRDAFKLVNGNPIARVSKTGNVEPFQNFGKVTDKGLNLRLFKETLKIGVLKAHPNLFSDEIRMFSKFDGLIIEGTGLGHLGINKIDELTKENLNVLGELKKLTKKMPVAMTSQCIFGRVNLNVYDTGRILQESGVLGNNLDMTFEAAYIKLAWLLSNYRKKEEIEDLFAKDLRGEISKRTIFEEEFI